MVELGERPLARHSLRATADAMRAVGKPRRGVSAWSVHVNRPAGRYVAALAHGLGLSPNRLSLLGGALSLTGIAALAVGPPAPATGLVAAAALVLGFVLDSADGQLARFTGRCTPAGEWLDHLVDCAVKLGLHGAVLVAWARPAGPGGWPLLLLPVGFQCVAVLLFFGGTAVLMLGGAPAHSGNAGRNGVLRSVFLLPVDHGAFCLTLVLWGWHAVFAPVYAMMFAAHLACFGFLSVVWFRRLRDA